MRISLQRIGVRLGWNYKLMENIIILLAVLLGFYLGRFKTVNKKARKAIQLVKKKVKAKEPELKGSLVVATDEVALEREQARAVLNKGETIDVKEVVKGG